MNHVITTINPATGQPLQTYQAWNARQIDQAADSAHAAAAAWGRQPLAERVAALRRLARQLRAQKDRFARLITAEMGKPLAEAAGELEKSAVTAEYYADNAARLVADEQ
ncbi:MAG: aldehyde dehydrogenase family protein, partial [Proteobacteria bacterium]|nr:aldehyde dehydrogenase family protein [Pseudomonadota bacterium]